MKLHVMAVLFLLIPFFSIAQIEKAPVCFQQGWKLVYQSKSDDKVSKYTEEVVSVNKTPDKWTVKILTRYDNQDKKTALPAIPMTYTMNKSQWMVHNIDFIKNDIYSIIKSFFPKDIKKDDIKPSDITITASADSRDTPYPNTMQKGQKAKSYPISIDVSIKFISYTISTATQRYECVGQERITVPAGTFDTYVVETDTKYKASFSLFSKSEVSHERIWLAAGIGTVKKQTLNKRGKVQSETVLATIIKK